MYNQYLIQWWLKLLINNLKMLWNLCWNIWKKLRNKDKIKLKLIWNLNEIYYGRFLYIFFVYLYLYELCYVFFMLCYLFS